MDRRKQKTQEAIIASFLALLKEKSLEKITISEIAHKANVNRGTFYLSYLDKYDLLDQFIELQLENLIRTCKSSDSTDNTLTKTSLIKIFEYLEDQKEFFKILLTNKSFVIFGVKLKEEIIQNLTAKGTNIDGQSELSIHFLSSAIIGVLEWWFTQKRPIHGDKIAEELWIMLNSRDSSFINVKEDC